MLGRLMHLTHGYDAAGRIPTLNNAKKALAPTIMVQHITKVAPKSAKVVFENEKLRVIEVVLSKGQKMAMHSHKPNLTYGLTDSKFRSTSEDGKSEVVSMKKGVPSWSDGGAHSVENLGSISRILSIELKG
jgi:hypothetical protein